MRRWIFTAAMMLGGLAFGSVVTTVVLTLVENRPAIKVLAQADVGQVAAHDGRIFIYSRIERIRSCRIETTHWLFTIVDGANGTDRVRAYVPLPQDGSVPVRGLGIASYVLSVPLPAGLWPAEWFFLESRAEFCGPLGWLFPIYSESEPLALDIEQARAVPDVPVTAKKDGKTIVRSRSPLPSPTVVRP